MEIPMEIMRVDQVLRSIDGRLHFAHSQIYVRKDGTVYSGRWYQRNELPIMIDNLDQLKKFPQYDRGPKVDVVWSGVYVKTPSLLSYIGENVEGRIVREVKACELLRSNPHPNIAAYYGHTEKNGRVTGLCFKRYRATLLETVSPEHLDKEAFRSSPRERVTNNIKHGLNGLLSGIKHLHALGLVHNDINPVNIMLDEDLRMILIDFDSCRYAGEFLTETNTKRTNQWHDPSVKVSTEKCDLDAFREVVTWLCGFAEEQYLFK